MKIQELEARTGLERPSIRFYEKEGLLNPKRLENGYRDYSEEDVVLLKKIRLLRRLGISIEEIRLLQHGQADLTDTVTRQISFHSSQIDDHRRCKAVCQAMREDGAEFVSLDSEHYMTMLREIKINDQPLAKTNFQEELPKEIHPWRRWLARWLDYLLWGAFAGMVWIVLLRVRPLMEDWGSYLFNIGALALYVPVEALLLHRFGTTPGKYIMGIRLEYIQGGNLPYPDALYRSLRVYVSGAGMGIPLVGAVLYLRRYCQLTGRSVRMFARYDEVEGPRDMPWDEDTELIYSNRSWKNIAALAALLALVAGLNVWSAVDGVRPRYRSDQLTVSQVASNYNATLRVLGHDYDYYDRLLEDGSRKPVAANTVIYDMNSSLGNYFMEYQYDVRDRIVTKVSASHEWDQVTFLKPLESDVLNMACSLLLAQEDCGLKELKEFLEIYRSHQNALNATFTYRNLVISWSLLSGSEMEDGVIRSDHASTVKLEFAVQILQEST